MPRGCSRPGGGTRWGRVGDRVGARSRWKRAFDFLYSLFPPRSPCWHGRTLEAEVIAQRVASVFRAEYTAPLQLRHHECHEVVEIARKQRRGKNEAVASLSLEPGLAVIGDLRRGANQGTTWGDAINELLHGEMLVGGQSFLPFQQLAVGFGAGGVYIREGTIYV